MTEITQDFHQRSPIMPGPDVRDLFADAEDLYDHVFDAGEGADIDRFINMTHEEVNALAKELVDLVEQDYASEYWDDEIVADEMERSDRHLTHYRGILLLYRNALQNGCRDGLSNLYNKVSFKEAIEKKLKQLADAKNPAIDRRAAVKSEKGAALIAIDLDRFKPFNDVFDHATGDAAIVAAAKLLQNHSRTEDTAGRLGGDEYSLLVSDVDESGAEKALEHLKQGFSELFITVFSDHEINLSSADLQKLGKDPREKWLASDLSEEDYDKLGLTVKHEHEHELLKLYVSASFGMTMLQAGMTAEEADLAADKDMIAYKNAHRHPTYSR